MIQIKQLFLKIYLKMKTWLTKILIKNKIIQEIIYLKIVLLKKKTYLNQYCKSYKAKKQIKMKLKKLFIN